MITYSLKKNRKRMNSNIMISTRHFFLRPVLISKPHSLGESLVKVGCWSGLWGVLFGREDGSRFGIL